MHKNNPNLYVDLITVADIRNRVLRISKASIEKARDLSSDEAAMINQYRHKYPDFRIEVV